MNSSGINQNQMVSISEHAQIRSQKPAEDAQEACSRAPYVCKPDWPICLVAVRNSSRDPPRLDAGTLIPSTSSKLLIALDPKPQNPREGALTSKPSWQSPSDHLQIRMNTISPKLFSCSTQVRCFNASKPNSILRLRSQTARRVFLSMASCESAHKSVRNALNLGQLTPISPK